MEERCRLREVGEETRKIQESGGRKEAAGSLGSFYGRVLGAVERSTKVKVAAWDQTNAGLVLFSTHLSLAHVLGHPASAVLIVSSSGVVVAVAMFVAIVISSRRLVKDSRRSIRLSVRLLCNWKAHPQEAGVRAALRSDVL